MWQPSELPIQVDLESKVVLKKLPQAHRALAELKGVVQAIPNEAILIDTLGLQEAKDSSAVENIVTTHDELYRAELDLKPEDTFQAKEVRNYVEALKRGFQLTTANDLLLSSHINQIQRILEQNQAGYRKVPGTALRNQKTQKVVYEPPQNPETIVQLMSNLEKYINDETLSDVDPLIKMAVIHFQFESIHPFYDGNGRTGRIINILYLILKGLLNIPVLYLSRYINQHKGKYYRYLQAVRDQGAWEHWLLYMIDAVEKTAIQTVELITEMRGLMLEYKHRIRDQFKFYSQDLLNNLFKHPYTKIEFIMSELDVSRPTAAGYLNELTKGGFLTKHRIGKNNYYVNEPLVELFEREYLLICDA